ncbi:MAG: alpha/beta fold hydrolase [Xanthomonadales bacterium]|nr:alpha/beta fold hydrolase [Xanthomonadales bacterium]
MNHAPRHGLPLYLLLAALLALPLLTTDVRAQAMAPAAETSLSQTDAVARAETFLSALDAGDWEQAHRMLDATAAAALPAAKLAEVWESLGSQLGARVERSPAQAERLGGVDVLTSRLRFPAMSLDARVHFDAAGKIDGFRIVPATTEPTPATPPPADSGITEEDRTVAGLSAKLTLPSSRAPSPAVVLVHGSGPNDMDETIGPNKPFRDIAHGLAARGVAVLRYHKRTKQRPQDFTPTSTLDDESIDDALDAVALLRAEPRVDAKRINVAGHSLGGLVAPRIASRDSELGGIILLAAPARKTHHVVPLQVRYIAQLDGTIDEAEAKSIAEFDAQRDAIDSMLDGGPEPETLMFGGSAAYWRDLGGYDPVRTAESLTLPILVLQGGRDYQITAADDFSRWQAFAQGRSQVQTRLFPKLNHLFIAGEGASTPQEYLQPGQVDSSVIDAMATWIGAL